jgi:hypothetical protein
MRVESRLSFKRDIRQTNGFLEDPVKSQLFNIMTADNINQVTVENRRL